MSASYLGDFSPLQTVRFPWSTNGANGASITRATNGTVSVYKDGGTTQSTTGVTDTEDFDSLTGIHFCAIDLTADTAFYAMGSDYAVVLSGAVIDGQAVNAVLGHFSIINRGIPLLAKGRMRAGSSGTVANLSSAETYGDDAINGGTLVKFSTPEARLVVDSVGGATDTATVDPAFATTPATGEPYVVIPSAPAPTNASYLETVAVGSITNGAIVEATFGTTAELAALPGTGALGPLAMVRFIYQFFRHARTATATTEKMYKADGTTVLGTSTLADDGTTGTRGALS